MHAIIPTGSTGEFARLSMDERKEVLEILGIEAGPPRPPLLPPSDEERQHLKAMLAALTNVPA